MEPTRGGFRLTFMHFRRLLVVVSSLLVLGASPALAQQTIEVNLGAGIDGYVAADGPGVLTVEVSSPTLFVGTIETSVAGSTNQSALEIAAGGRKLLEFPFLAPGANATAFVRVLDTDGNETVRATLPLKAPVDSLVVGVLDSPAVERQLDSVRSTPLGQPVESLPISFEHLDPRLEALSYLVAAPGTAQQMNAEQLDAVTDWVADGGRLIVSQADAGLFRSEQSQALGEAEIGALGKGEVIAIDALESLPNETWATVLRDVPRPAQSFVSFGRGQDGNFQLLEAASFNNDASLPNLSWLLLGLLGYVLAVGPINLLVLRRLDKTHLTWVTVPALATLTVGLFWLGGPRDSDAAALLQSSVIVYDGASSTAESGVIVVAGKEGRYAVDFPAGWSAFPVDYAGQFGQGGGQEAVTTLTDDGVEIAFDLPNLGAGSATASWTPEGEPFAVDVSANGDVLEFTVTNQSDQQFWYWGVVRGSDGVAGQGTLGPDDRTGIVSLTAGANGENFDSPIIEAYWSRGGFGDGREEQSLWPLSYAATNVGVGQGGDDAYVFGFVNGFALPLSVDGTPVTATGPTLVIQPIDLPELQLTVGAALPELLAIEGADFVEGTAYQLYIGGAEAVYLSYRVPSSVQQAEFRDVWGGGFQNTFALYDWSAGQFTEVDPNAVDLTTFRGPTGEVVAEVSSNEFNEIVPTAIELRWTP